LLVGAASRATRVRARHNAPGRTRPPETHMERTDIDSLFDYM
jgi:hypothetical protein